MLYKITAFVFGLLTIGAVLETLSISKKEGMSVTLLSSCMVMLFAFLSFYFWRKGKSDGSGKSKLLK